MYRHRWFSAVLITMVLLMLGCGGSKKKKEDLAKVPHYTEAITHFNSGINLLNQDNKKDSLLSFKKAVEMEPNNFRFQHWLGFAYMINGDFERAESHFNTALEINPEHTDTKNSLASMLIDLQRIDEAQQLLKEVIQDKTFNAPEMAYYNLGLSFLEQGKTDQAIAAFKQATYLSQDFHRAYFALGKIYQSEGNQKEALANFLRAEEGYPNDAEVLFQIGKTYFKEKKYREAQKYLTQVSILFPPPDIDEPTQLMLQVIERSYR